MSRLHKPDKVYFENTAFVHAFQKSVNAGTVRETFFLNQIHHSGNNIHLSTTGGDFIVNEEAVFEIGGKNKSQRQISGLENAWLAMDAMFRYCTLVTYMIVQKIMSHPSNNEQIPVHLQTGWCQPFYKK